MDLFSFLSFHFMCVTVTVVTGHSVALNRRSHLFSMMLSLHDVVVHDSLLARGEASPQCKKQRLRRCLHPIILVVDTSSSSLFELRMPVSLEFRLCSLRHFAMAFFSLPFPHMKRTKGLAPLKPQRELRRELPHRSKMKPSA
jgi:hypothetical protein